MGLLVADPQFGEQLENALRLNLQLSCQLVNADLLHKRETA
jgi:hypothetical protein